MSGYLIRALYIQAQYSMHDAKEVHIFNLIVTCSISVDCDQTHDHFWVKTLSGYFQTHYHIPHILSYQVLVLGESKVNGWGGKGLNNI